MRWIPCIPIVLLGSWANAQEFQQRYDAFQWGRAQTGWGIERSGEGFVLLSASEDADTLGPDSFLFHGSTLLTGIDQAGAKLWEKRHYRPLHGTYPGWSNCCDTVQGGGFIVGAGTESLPPAVYEIHLIRFDANGDTLWTRNFGGAGEEWIGRQVKHTADGGFLIVGDTDASGYVDGFALKTDSAGNEEWRETYGSGALDYFVASDRAETGYFLGGVRFLDPDDSQFWVQRVDSIGSVRWSVTWGDTWKQTNAHLITLMDGNAMVFGGWGHAVDFTLGKPYLAKLDSSDGSIIWDREFGTPTYSTTFFAGKETTNGDLIACGVSYAGGNQQGLLLRTTSEGDSIWMRTYYYQDTLMSDGTGRFYDVLPTSDGGFIAAGAAYHSATLGYPAGYSQDTWVVKVDSMGCIVPGCDGVGVSEIVTNLTNAISVFPNPAHGSAVVQVDLPVAWHNDPALELSVVNGQGQVVDQQHVHQGSNTLDLSAFSAGLYFVHLSAGSTWLSGTKLMIE